MPSEVEEAEKAPVDLSGVDYADECTVGPLSSYALSEDGGCHELLSAATQKPHPLSCAENFSSSMFYGATKMATPGIRTRRQAFAREFHERLERACARIIIEKTEPSRAAKDELFSAALSRFTSTTHGVSMHLLSTLPPLETTSEQRRQVVLRDSILHARELNLRRHLKNRFNM